VSTEPAEHVRFRNYVDTLAHVSDADECEVLAHVLSDPDRVMADSAVIGHLDRRAATLEGGASFSAWSQQIARVLRGRELPERRLREWSLLKEIDSGRPWSIADLIAASDWLQRRLAEHTGSERALTALAEQGRTRRIKNTARSRLGRPPA
jgi:hypothetical protein